MKTTNLSTVADAIRFTLATEKSIQISFTAVYILDILEKIISGKENGEYFLFELVKGREHVSFSPATDVLLKVTFYKYECRIVLLIREESYSYYEDSNPIEVINERNYHFTYVTGKRK